MHALPARHEIELRMAFGFGPSDHLTPFHCCAIALQLVLDGQETADSFVACDGRCEDHLARFHRSTTVTMMLGARFWGIA
jgi:hypothetical protein